MSAGPSPVVLLVVAALVGFAAVGALMLLR
jgi:hypothetical protein